MIDCDGDIGGGAVTMSVILVVSVGASVNLYCVLRSRRVAGGGSLTESRGAVVFPLDDFDKQSRRKNKLRCLTTEFGIGLICLVTRGVRFANRCAANCHSTDSVLVWRRARSFEIRLFCFVAQSRSERFRNCV